MTVPVAAIRTSVDAKVIAHGRKIAMMALVMIAIWAGGLVAMAVVLSQGPDEASVGRRVMLAVAGVVVVAVLAGLEAMRLRDGLRLQRLDPGAARREGAGIQPTIRPSAAQARDLDELFATWRDELEAQQPGITSQ
jgi:hypothetical protein